jgi:predicted DNA-binding protein (UPF0251 family)
MPSETIDYAAVLADLEAQRAAIDAAIAGVRRMLNLGAEQVTPSAASMSKDQSTEVRSDSFFGMTMPDAITKFLSMAKRTQSVSEITQALQFGGFPTTAKNLMPSVGSTLSRMKAAGDVASVQGKWGLSSWYPGKRKAKLETRATKAKNGRRRGRPRASKATAQSDKSQHPPVGTPKLTAEQVEQIKMQRAEGKTQKALAEEFGVSQGTVWSILSGRTWKTAHVNGKTEPRDGANAQD